MEVEDCYENLLNVIQEHFKGTAKYECATLQQISAASLKIITVPLAGFDPVSKISACFAIIYYHQLFNIPANISKWVAYAVRQYFITVYGRHLHFELNLPEYTDILCMLIKQELTKILKEKLIKSIHYLIRNRMCNDMVEHYYGFLNSLSTEKIGGNKEEEIKVQTNKESKENEVKYAPATTMTQYILKMSMECKLKPTPTIFIGDSYDQTKAILSSLKEKSIEVDSKCKQLVALMAYIRDKNIHVFLSEKQHAKIKNSLMDHFMNIFKQAAQCTQETYSVLLNTIALGKTLMNLKQYSIVEEKLKKIQIMPTK